MLCCVCLLESPNIMDIFDDLGEKLNVADIINEHFWFKPEPNDSPTSQICKICWSKIDDFHIFYKTVEKAHQDFQKIQKNQSNIKDENRNCFTIKEETFEDENILHNLMQLEVEIVDNLNKYKQTDDSKELKNPLWNDENDSDCYGESDSECDSSEDCGEEKPKTSKRKSTLKSEKNEDYSKKKRKSRHLDPILSEEVIKKHIPMVCYVCDFVGQTFSDIKIHFKDHHPDMKPYIMCCNRKFDRNYVIAEHAAIHENPDCFRCFECNKSFTAPKGLRAHNIEFHGPDEQKMHACEFCPRKFGRKNLLELHRQSHIPKDQWSFTCVKCTTRTIKFASQYLLNIHISMFHNRKINVCHVCSKEIKDKKAFEKHVRLHFETSGPRIKCPIDTCESWLKDEDNVKYHIQRYHKDYKWSEFRKTLPSNKQEDEKLIENDLMQIEVDLKYQLNENSITLTNPLENSQNDVKCEDDDDESDFECDKSEEYQPSEMSDNDSDNDEEKRNDVKSEKKRKRIKRKPSRKSDQNEDSTKKTRLSHRLDPKISEEMVKKYVQMVCDLCIFVGDTFQDLKEHFKDHHANVKPYVMCCNRKFDRLYVITQHAARHENPDCFRCIECNKSFTTPYGLRTHHMEHHAPDAEKMHACEYCPRKFQRKNLLEQHRPIHIPKEQWTFNCDKCTTRTSIFASQYLLNIHNSMHHRKESNIHVCHVCAKEIKDKKAFEKHVRYHFEDSGPRLKCPLPDCNSWLKDEDNLKTHMQLHNIAGKTYKCTECDRECPNRRALSAHKRFVHSKQIFRCEECDKTFKTALGLREHMTQHTGETLYTCPFCPRTFNSNANMHSHKKKKHPVEWEELRRQKIGPVPSYTN